MSRSLRCEFIDAEKTTYGVRRLCRVLAVSKTAYYDWVARLGGPTSHEVDEAYAIHELRQDGIPLVEVEEPAGHDLGLADHVAGLLVHGHHDQDAAKR